jgi:Uncharacterised protein family (UPF0158)
MGHDPWLESLRRGAGDASELAELLAGGLPGDALQHIGDAMFAVPTPWGPDLTEIVGRLMGRLRDRGWDGDHELAEALQGVVDGTSPLRTLRVELDDVGEALNESDGTENFLDLREGTVWFHTMPAFGVDEDLDVDLSDESRFLFLPGEGSYEAYRDLQRFIGTVDDRDLAARLSHAVEGKGAFRRFRAVLEREDAAEFTRWHRFAGDARLGHARRWLSDQGYQARPARSVSS